MSAPFWARAILTALAAGQGAGPLFIDLNRTHATNPDWPGHARFHLVWLSLTLALAGAAEVALIWWAGPGANNRFYLAAIFTGIPLAAFFAAQFSRRMYGGTMHDPNGIPPARIHMFSHAIEFDLNTVVVAVAAAVLVVAVVLY